MDHRIFLNVDLRRWICGTTEKVQNGDTWVKAWTTTYKEIGGRSCDSGRKVCPMVAARTLHEFGRIRDGGTPFLAWDMAVLWGRSRNGTYAMLAIELLSANPALNKTQLWRRVQEAVRRETGDEPAASNQGGAALAFQLWHLGFIVEAGA